MRLTHWKQISHLYVSNSQTHTSVSKCHTFSMTVTHLKSNSCSHTHTIIRLDIQQHCQNKISKHCYSIVTKIVITLPGGMWKMRFLCQSKKFFCHSKIFLCHSKKFLCHSKKFNNEFFFQFPLCYVDTSMTLLKQFCKLTHTLII